MGLQKRKIKIVGIVLALVLSGCASTKRGPAQAEKNLDGVIDWANNFANKNENPKSGGPNSYEKSYNWVNKMGVTTDGRACEFNVFRRHDENSFYFSLGRAEKGSPKNGRMTYIGMPVNPKISRDDYERDHEVKVLVGPYVVNAMEANESSIHVNVTQTEAEGFDKRSGTMKMSKPISNDLTIELKDGNVVRVIGKSDFHPSSTCVIK